MYVFIYVQDIKCMYVCTVCIADNVCMYVCICVLYRSGFVSAFHRCMYVCMHAYTVCMYVCM